MTAIQVCFTCLGNRFCSKNVEDPKPTLEVQRRVEGDWEFADGLLKVVVDKLLYQGILSISARAHGALGRV